MVYTPYVYFYTVLLLLLNMCFFLYKKTLILHLISLELLMFMMIMLYIGPFAFLYNVLTYFVVFLCFAAMGACVGLGILITYSRQVGNDYVKSLPCEKNLKNTVKD